MVCWLYCLNSRHIHLNNCKSAHPPYLELATQLWIDVVFIWNSIQYNCIKGCDLGPKFIKLVLSALDGGEGLSAVDLVKIFLILARITGPKVAIVVTGLILLLVDKLLKGLPISSLLKLVVGLLSEKQPNKVVYLRNCLPVAMQKLLKAKAII